MSRPADPASKIAVLRGQMRALKRQLAWEQREHVRMLTSAEAERDLVRRAFLAKAAESLLNPSERFLDAVVNSVHRRLPPDMPTSVPDEFVARHRSAMLSIIRSEAIKSVFPHGDQGEA